MNFARTTLLAVLLTAGFVVPARPGGAAGEPFEINAILSLTGPAAFLGTKEEQSLHAMETVINASGGIKGRPLKFVVSDDQSNPQLAVQLVSAMAAKKVPAIEVRMQTPPIASGSVIMFIRSGEVAKKIAARTMVATAVTA